MAGAVRLFALSEQGLLFEVAPERASDLGLTAEEIDALRGR
jgi:hypothetical protein